MGNVGMLVGLGYDLGIGVGLDAYWVELDVVGNGHMGVGIDVDIDLGFYAGAVSVVADIYS